MGTNYHRNDDRANANEQSQSLSNDLNGNRTKRTTAFATNDHYYAQFAHRSKTKSEAREMNTFAVVNRNNDNNKKVSIDTGERKEEPLSAEDVLRKRKLERLEAEKPKFLSKKEREKVAMERLREQRKNALRDVRSTGQAAGNDGLKNNDDRNNDSSNVRSRYQNVMNRDDVVERDTRYRNHQNVSNDSVEQLEMFRKQYAGVRDETEKQRKLKRKQEQSKYKFQFDWSKDDDTSRDLNPLYDQKFDGKILFGRGSIAGIDNSSSRAISNNNNNNGVGGGRRDSNYHNNNKNYINNSENKRQQKYHDSSSYQLQNDNNNNKDQFYDKNRKQQTHWSSKPLAEMNERDWRIFREDFNIQFKGGKVPNPMRAWSENELLPKEILRAIQKVGYEKPSPIQMASIPIGLLKRDVIGVAETGSGKTCAFVVPMLAHIMGLPKMTDDIAANGPYALIMAPTRELAQQIEAETLKFAQFLGYRVACVVGGQSIEDQGVQLRKGVEIVVGTPGRIIDVIEKRYTVLNQCNYIVLDEADRMIDMGFEPQVTQVMEAMPSSNLKPIDIAEELDNSILVNSSASATTSTSKSKYRTTYMFSATMPPSVERLARTYLRNPAVVTIGSAGKTSDLIKQEIIWVNRAEKERMLEQILSQHTKTQAIVFVNTKRAVDSCVTACHSMGYSCGSIHGGKGQDAREAALTGFKKGDFDILVATDVAGRGIDVKDIDLVVNYELPNLIENYTHRIGRTGRAGRKGTAVSFLTAEDQDIMYDLRNLLIESNNQVPPELERQKAAKVKPQRDASGRVMQNDGKEMRGMSDIIF